MRQTVARRLESEFLHTINAVIATGDWTRDELDLHTLPLAEVAPLIVLDVPERPFELYLQIADKVFSHLDDDDILVQFRLVTASEWRILAGAARERGASATLGIPPFVRA